MKVLVFVIFTLAFCNLSFAGTCSEIESRTITHDFYAELKASGTTDIPSVEALSKLKPLISKSLYELLGASVKVEEEYDHLPPENKEAPPYEGSLFSTWDEGYTNFYVSKAVPGSDNMEVFVLFQYAQHSLPYYESKPGIDEWKERVRITREGNACLVDDIYFVPGHNDKSLKGRLKEIISESAGEAEYHKKK